MCHSIASNCYIGIVASIHHVLVIALVMKIDDPQVLATSNHVVRNILVPVLLEVVRRFLRDTQPGLSILSQMV